MKTSPLADETADAIAANVALVQDSLLKDQGIAGDDWENAVAYLAGFIDRMRTARDADKNGRLADVIGSYLGEAVVQVHNGQWVQTDRGIAVTIKGLTAFPFAKVEKHFADGGEAGENIASFLRVVPALLERSKAEDDQ